MVVQECNPSTEHAETGGPSQVQGQPRPHCVQSELCNETLFLESPVILTTTRTAAAAAAALYYLAGKFEASDRVNKVLAPCLTHSRSS